eukprot:59561-Chlamydomonas_euryale.AAC.2
MVQTALQVAATADPAALNVRASETASDEDRNACVQCVRCIPVCRWPNGANVRVIAHARARPSRRPTLGDTPAAVLWATVAAARACRSGGCSG